MDRHSTAADDYQALPRPIGVLGKSYAAGTDIPLHEHRRGQLLYAMSGIMRVATEGAVFILPPNRALWLPPGVPHALRILAGVEMRNLYIAPEVALFPEPTPKILAMTLLVRALILRLLEEPPLYDEEGSAGLIARLLLSEIPRLAEVPLSAALPADPRLRRLTNAILAEPARDWSLERAAEIAALSPRTLERHIQDETGLSYGRWRQQLLMLEAISLLASGLTIADVTRRLGYANASAFAAAFKRSFGQSPSDFRTRNAASGRDG
ncbi:helix-turn-helix domain-containing protein [Lacibacterium aquatile]|uniref:Helix-turn-helix domain-containing protein n=1 Tax=Lacibacterium aquatile TaxID=1168082 RepID=A0ABW5DXC2_9PROT